MKTSQELQNAALRTSHMLSNVSKGNRTIADLRYGEEDIIHPNTLI